MKVAKVLERVEKFRLLGRYDKISGIDFLNDGLHVIKKRQGIVSEKLVENFTGGTYKFTDEVLISFKGIELKDDKGKIKIAVNNNGDIIFYISDAQEGWKKTVAGDIDITFTIHYIGYTPIDEDTTEFELPLELESALVYFIRAKMLGDFGEVEISNSQFNEFLKEMSLKVSPKRDVISKPSEYSLL